MSSKKSTGESVHSNFTGQPHLHQKSPEIQPYGTVSHMLPLELEEPIRLEMTEQLNQILADTMTLRHLYKKSHWQTSGPTFYQLHLLFDKHYAEQAELVDTIAERIQLLGGHQIVIGEVRILARLASKLGDDGTNDLLVSDVLRGNELQAWFLSEHLVEMPLVHATQLSNPVTAP